MTLFKRTSSIPLFVALATPVLAQETLSPLAALQTPELGAKTCATGGGTSSTRSSCWVNVRRTDPGDYAVYGLYADEQDREGSVYEGTDLLALEAGDADLIFDLNRNNTLFVDASSLFLRSDGASTRMTVGDGGGAGRVAIGPNALLSLESWENLSRMRIGDNGNGVLTLYESGLNIEAVAGQPNDGEVTGAVLEVGHGAGSHGTLYIGDADYGYASTVNLIANGDAGARFSVGSEGGTGTVKAVQGQINLFSATEMMINIGADPNSNGTLNLLAANAGLNTSGAGDVRMIVGSAPESSGAVNVYGGMIGLSNASNQTSLFIGGPQFDADPDAVAFGGSGSMDVSGYVETFIGPDEVPVTRVQNGFVFANQIGVGASSGDDGLGLGGSGELKVGYLGEVFTDELYVGGLPADAPGGSQSMGRVAVFNGGLLQAGGTSSLDVAIIGAGGVVTVSGSSVDPLDADKTVASTLRGSEILLNGTAAHDGLATLIVENGGMIELSASGRIVVGEGGFLGGNGGTILGDLVNQGGVIGPGASPGTMNITGDLLLESGLLQMEIAGTGAGQFDVLNVGGSILTSDGGAPSIVVSFLEGFDVGAGDVFEFLNVNGSVSDGFFDNVSFEGLGGAAEPDLFGDGEGSFAFAHTNPYVAPVPLPPSLWLMLAGFGALFSVRRHALA